MSALQPNFLFRAWRALRRPSARWSVLALVGLGFVVGVIAWAGFDAGIAATSDNEFCTSCHEMRDAAFREYQQTIHYSNRTGVRASCSDCHVPRDWLHKTGRKFAAASQLWGKITGVIDTPAKYEAKRAALARRVWERMERTDSLECRNCHVSQAMNRDLQRERAQKRHASGLAEGKTCIDCHFGIAHDEPEGPTPLELFGNRRSN